MKKEVKAIMNKYDIKEAKIKKEYDEWLEDIKTGETDPSEELEANEWFETQMNKLNLDLNRELKNLK